MLPRARIVDVRRHLMACGLSVFKHLFARGQHFSYSHENACAVSTPSSEQVRSPISSAALDHWRHYEPWLAPLAQALDHPGGSDSPHSTPAA